MEREPDPLRKKKVNEIQKIRSMLNEFKSSEWTEIKEEQEEKRKENEKFKNESQINLEKETVKKRDNNEFMNGIISNKIRDFFKKLGEMTGDILRDLEVLKIKQYRCFPL